MSRPVAVVVLALSIALVAPVVASAAPDADVTTLRDRVARDGSPRSRIALAAALSKRGGKADVDEARALLADAVRDAPDDDVVASARCGFLAQHDTAAAARTCIDPVLAAHPDSGPAHLIAATIAGLEHGFLEADMHLDRAEQAGMPYHTIFLMRMQLDAADDEARAARSAGPSWLPKEWALVPLGIVSLWFCWCLLIAVPAWLLSGLTGWRARRARAPRSRGGVLARLGGVAIWLVGGTIAATLPLAAIVLLGAGVCGVLAHGLTASGDLLWSGLLAAATVGGIVVMVRRSLAPPRQLDPGARVDLDARPELRRLLDEIAGQIGVAPAVAVFVTAAPGTQASIYDRRWQRPARGTARRERCLVLGQALLDGPPAALRRALLRAHAMHDRTAGGGGARAVRVRRQLDVLRSDLMDAWIGEYNPLAWFVRGAVVVYDRITAGAVARQARLADERVAAELAVAPAADAGAVTAAG
ncbi:MAG: hypothetical protein H6708_26585 [Kofleriaceae bacterium]|nr:hypothetical protein [Kofleriaceae bacterium]